MKKKIFPLLVVVALVGCDKLKSDSSTTTTTTSTTTATATVTANEILTATVTATTAAPTVTATAMATATASAAAGGWPLPDYPNAKVTKKTADYVSLETKDSPDKVVAFYKDKLKAAGFPPGPWASLAGAKDQQPTVMTASKGSQMVQVTVTPVQGTTKISLSSI